MKSVSTPELRPLGSRLVVNNKNADRIGIHLTQKGPIVGVEASF